MVNKADLERKLIELQQALGAIPSNLSEDIFNKLSEVYAIVEDLQWDDAKEVVTNGQQIP